MKRISGLILVFLLLAGCVSGGAWASQSAANTNSARLHTELAGLYFERNQMGIALSETDLAIRADRNYAPAYSMRGLIHMALHEDKEADEAFQHGLHLDGADSEAHNNYGWFLCQRGKHSESITHFIAAVKNPLYTTPERAYLNAGLCSQKAGNTADAEDFLGRALSLQPALPQALLAMAEIRFAKGDYPAAKKYFTNFAQHTELLTAAQLWLAIRIERKLGDRNAEASYGLQLRKYYPDASETQSLMNGE
ncbi:MAG: type IV pilus biogenesis/stability protein PilW [Gallionella sp.]|nr:type IV pilus biogenesis/stability protein PilW [Gallionella sp.]MDD4947755.1 type IV pilus biogenesis/stability protein PilW [Gallionella sp.]MDD5612938.1 type IV pilus biogenesis/stability protein PilW [Gallionella sp.]